jgi:hypothetical protein
MKSQFIYFSFLVFSVLFITSCESEAERKQRLAREEQQRIELAAKRKQQEAEKAYRLEQERKKEEARLEKERQERVIYNKYINNSLSNGATPYSYCYGKNVSCSEWGCSEIKVRTPNNSDVLVTIKKGQKVVKHAFIKAGQSYTFEMPNGTYQPFFYYGKGWNPEKVMKQTNCGPIKGGFISNGHFGKDSPQNLSNNILNYELVLQQNGNFSTSPSNATEAL